MNDEAPREPPVSAVGPSPQAATATGATRKDLQIGRRLAHMANGVVIAGAYTLLFTHQQVVHVFGVVACLVYIADRVRIHYPDAVGPAVNRLLFRAEEQARESAMVPYAVAILLTILTFPKPAALVAIYTLAVADPLSAIVGIRWGRRRVVPDKSLEGSAAFFAAALAIGLAVLYATNPGGGPRVAAASALVAASGAVFEMLPLRIDDNLTIPLFVGFAAWIVCAALGVSLG